MTLFDNEVPTEAQTHTKPPDSLSAVARARLGVPDTWSVYKWERSGNGLIVGVAEEHILTKGKRKGKKTWKTGDRRNTFVSEAEIEAADREWEVMHNKCANCGGDGQESAGWSQGSSLYRTCSSCDGTGIPATGIEVANEVRSVSDDPHAKPGAHSDEQSPKP